MARELEDTTYAHSVSDSAFPKPDQSEWGDGGRWPRLVGGARTVVGAVLLCPLTDTAGCIWKSTQLRAVHASDRMSYHFCRLFRSDWRRCRSTILLELYLERARSRSFGSSARRTAHCGWDAVHPVGSGRPGSRRRASLLVLHPDISVTSYPGPTYSRRHLPQPTRPSS